MSICSARPRLSTAALHNVADLGSQIAQLEKEKAQLAQTIQLQEIDSKRYEAVKVLYQAQNVEILALREVSSS